MTTLSKAIHDALAEPAERIGKIIAITNQKGGVGKTSTSFNFAHFLHEMGYRVLVVDLDGQGNLTELFFEPNVLIEYVHTPAVALFQRVVVDDFHPLVHPSGIDVLATRRNCHELNDVDTKPIDVAQTFYENLSSIAKDYDFVVCDTPPAPGVRTTAACASADYIYAPVLVDTFAESALEGVVSSIESIGAILGADLKLTGVLINQLQDSSIDARQEYKSLSLKIGDALIRTPVRMSKPFARAQRKGIPVWHLRRSGSEQKTSRDTRKAYGEMASRIAEISSERIEHFNEVSRAVRAKFEAESVVV